MSKKVFILAFVWLLVVNVLGVLAFNRFNLTSDTAYSWIPVEKYVHQPSWDVETIHSRWDSNWYVDLARDGYQRKENDTLSNLVFFPLYPFLMKTLSFFMGGNLILAGWFVSSVFLMLSALMLYRLTEEFHKKANPLEAVFLLLIFPTAFFLNAIYTESLFLFLSLATFYFSSKQNYKLAGLFGFLASLTRITGILLFIPLVIQFVMKHGWSLQKMAKAWPLLFIPLGTGSFFLYHWIFFGDPILFFTIESAWGRSFSINQDHFIFLSSASMANFCLDVFYLLFGTGIALYLLKRKEYPYAMYMLSTMGVAVSSGTLMSIGRYILVLFPIYIIGASIKNEIVRYAWILISTMLMGLNTYLFVNWYWAG